MSRLGTAIGLGYGGNPQRSDGTDEFRQEFARGQAQRAAKEAAAAKARQENKNQVLSILKDLDISAQMQPFLMEDSKQKIAPILAQVTNTLSNPDGNSVITAMSAVREIKSIMDHYKTQNKIWEEDIKKYEVAAKDGYGFMSMDNNPINIGGKPYKNVYEALNFAPEARTQDGYEEIVRQAKLPGEFDITRNDRGLPVINSSLSIPVGDVEKLVDKSIQKGDFTNIDETKYEDVKGPFGVSLRRYKVGMSDEIKSKRYEELLGNPMMLKSYVNLDWVQYKKENPTSTFTDYMASDRYKALQDEIPTKIQSSLSARSNYKDIQGSPKNPSSSGYDPAKRLSVSPYEEAGKTVNGVVISAKDVGNNSIEIRSEGVNRADQVQLKDPSLGVFVPAKDFLKKYFLTQAKGSLNVQGRPNALSYDSNENVYYAEYIIPNSEFGGGSSGITGQVVARVPMGKDTKEFANFARAYGMSAEQMNKFLDNNGQRIQLKDGSMSDWMGALQKQGIPYAKTQAQTDNAAKRYLSTDKNKSSGQKTSGSKPPKIPITANMTPSERIKAVTQNRNNGYTE